MRPSFKTHGPLETGLRQATALTAARATETTADFATDLIASKPVKPCDGGVFGALNLLLFL